MKTIGLIGGMSWESSLEYYRIINEEVKKQVGDSHSSKSILYSVDFAEIEALQHQGEWNQLTTKMIGIAKTLEKAGADLLVICTNTMHKMAGDIQSNSNIPLVHIVDAVAEKIIENNMTRVGLLGTKFTMEQDFYVGKLREEYNIEVVIPNDEDREIVHQIIYEELILGIIKDDSRNKYIKVINKLKDSGAEGVILGCTEIPLLIKEKDSPIPIFDTTTIHSQKAVNIALEK